MAMGQHKSFTHAIVEGTGYESPQALKSETIESSLILIVSVTLLRWCTNSNTLSKMADARGDLKHS